MSYQPGQPPADAGQLRSFIEQELSKIAQALNADTVQLRELHVEPGRIRAGMVVLADGTDWDPGSGAGVYAYYGGAWVKLG